jgi:hypothetical protein
MTTLNKKAVAGYCYKIYLSILGVLFLIPAVAVSQSATETNPVSTAAPLLRISADTRAAALGETGIATSADASSIFLNAAKTVFAKEEGGLSLNHVSWLREITSGFYLLSLSGYQKIDDKQAISGSIRYYNTGKVEERDYNGTLLQLATPREFAIDAAYSRLLSDKLSMSIAFRYIRSSLGASVNAGTTSGGAGALLGDISVFYNGVDDEGRGFTAGAVLANIGTGKIDYGSDNGNNGFVPARIGVGAGYHLPIDDENKLMFTADFNKSMVPLIPDGANGIDEYYDYSVIKSYFKGIGNEAFSVSAGAEYIYKDLLSVRAGYFAESGAYGGRKYMSTGLGLKLNQFGLNFAYIVPSGDNTLGNALSNTLRFGVTFSPVKE